MSAVGLLFLLADFQLFVYNLNFRAKEFLRFDEIFHRNIQNSIWRHLAEILGSNETKVWSFLKDPTLINCRDPTNGMSLLHSLLYPYSLLHQKVNKEGHEELLEFLLTKIDVNITDNHGATPLHYCCRYVHFPSENLLKLLLKQSNINVNATMTYTRYSFDNR